MTGPGAVNWDYLNRALGIQTGEERWPSTVLGRIETELSIAASLVRTAYLAAISDEISTPTPGAE